MWFIVSIVGIILHVINYNATAQIEYNTRIFTKVLGKNAVYYYAVYLVLSALTRDHLINNCLDEDAKTLRTGLEPEIQSFVLTYLGTTLFVFGFALNLWTLKALGIKGMYNGDSFGYLFDAPVTDGPYQYFNDPQYVGTTLAMFGSALYYESMQGIVLTVVMGIVFYISVHFVEGPHMRRIYSQKGKQKKST